MIDLADGQQRYNLVRRIEADVDAFSIASLGEGPRNHLGASEIGHPCSAKAWGNFRWLKQEKHSGQILRLFKRGHFEEPKFIAILRGIGFEFHEFAGDGKQFRISGSNGHFGGSLDGMAMAPASYGIGKPLLVEFKTHNDKSFTKLAGSKDKATGVRKFVTGTNGVRVTKPVHYSQMCVYGRGYDFDFALYVAINKDSDELYFEIVPLDWRHADDLIRKADFVISSQEQPPKIAQVQTYFECKYCHLDGICFRGELPEKNCRSCVYAKPIELGRWHCTHPDRQVEISGDLKKRLGDKTPQAYQSDELIKTGCDSWKAIING